MSRVPPTREGTLVPIACPVCKGRVQIVPYKRILRCADCGSRIVRRKS